MSRPARHFALPLVAALALASAPAGAQVAVDDSFDASVAEPAFGADAGPFVVIDEAHKNLHSAGGRYAAFAAVAKADGFRVAPGTATFTTDGLPAGDAILVIANAQGAEKPTDPALAEAEIAALVGWVERGGSLFLIADHAPFGAATAAVTRAFGVESHDGHVEDEEHAVPGLPGPYFLLFSSENGLLGEHPIVAGRAPEERVDAVVTFGGQALDPGATGGISVLLRFGPKARIHSAPNGPDDLVEPIAGRAQMVAFARGKGRVVLAGEAGMFAAQTIRGEAATRAGVPDPFHFGMTHPAGRNKQLLLNTLRWLARRD